MINHPRNDCNGELHPDDPTSIFDVPVSLFPHAKAQIPTGAPTIGEVLEDIRTGRYQAQVEKLRDILKIDQAEYNDEKKNLPAISLSAHLKHRKGKDGENRSIPIEKKLIAHSGFLQIDLDKKTNTEMDLPATKEILKADPHTAFCFISPSGEGLKVGVRIDSAKHHQSFLVAEKYYQRRYRLAIDRSVKDVVRLCFVSYDPDLFINEKAVPFALSSNCLTIAQKMIREAADGTKHDTLLRASYLLGGYIAGGIVTEDEARQTLRTAIEQKPNVRDLAAAFRTIDSGLNDGKAAPLTDDGPKKQEQHKHESPFFDFKGKPLKHKKASFALLPQLGEYAYDAVAKTFYRYRNGMFSAITDHAFCEAVDHLMTEMDPVFDYNSDYLSGIVRQLTMYLSWSEDEAETDFNLIPFRNGVLNLKTKELLPHSPKYRFTWQLPYAYNSLLTCEPVQGWLFEATKDRMQVQLLRAFLYCVLTGRGDWHRYLELIGPGGSGKGTFIRLAESIIGKKNVHVTELKHLETNRFETARIYNKRLCVITDAEKYSGDVSTLKAMTGGDSLRFEEKHKQKGESFRFRGMVIIAANQDIKTADTTSGLYRRRITVGFDNAIAPEKRRDLESEFEPYLPGVINWVLAMPEEEAKTYIVNTDRLVKTLNGRSKQMLINVNVLADFLHERTVYDMDTLEVGIGVCRRDDSRKILDAETLLYPAYCLFCEETNRKPMTPPVFVTSLKDLLKNQLKLPIVHKSKRNGKFFIGLGLRTASNANLPSPLDAVFGFDDDSQSGSAEHGPYEQSSGDGPVTDCDGPVTDDVTDQTRMVTNVTDFHVKNSSENAESEGSEAQRLDPVSLDDPTLAIFGKSLQRSVTSETSVTMRVEPVTSPSQSPSHPSQSPSQSVTPCEKCDRMKRNAEGKPFCLQKNGRWIELSNIKKCPKTLEVKGA